MMADSPIVKEDLLFHSVHGLCRVASVARAQSEHVSYSLVPVSSNRANVRFIIPGHSLASAGFSKLISVKAAEAILEYLKTGKKKDQANGQTWDLAEFIKAESLSKDLTKDTRKRQKVERSVKGLAGEIGLVLEMPPRETAARIRQNMESAAKIHPVVLAALENAGKD